MHDLEARDAAIEYWFFKFNHEGLAFLVDFILRGERDRGEIASASGSTAAAGSSMRTSAWSTKSPFVTIGDCTFGDRSSRGVVGDVEWDLSYETRSRACASRRATP